MPEMTYWSTEGSCNKGVDSENGLFWEDARIPAFEVDAHYMT